MPAGTRFSFDNLHCGRTTTISFVHTIGVVAGAVERTMKWKRICHEWGQCKTMIEKRSRRVTGATIIYKRKVLFHCRSCSHHPDPSSTICAELFVVHVFDWCWMKIEWERDRDRYTERKTNKRINLFDFLKLLHAECGTTQTHTHTGRALAKEQEWRKK